MKEILKDIKKTVVSVTFQERRKRALARYVEEKKRLMQMSEDELNLEFIDSKCAYEHKKNWLTAILVSILIAVLMSVWKSFGSFIGNALQYMMPDQSMEVYKVGLVLCTILVFFLTFAIAWILIAYFREIKRLYRKILLIECVKKKVIDTNNFIRLCSAGESEAK